MSHARYTAYCQSTANRRRWLSKNNMANYTYHPVLQRRALPLSESPYWAWRRGLHLPYYQGTRQVYFYTWFLVYFCYLIYLKYTVSSFTHTNLCTTVICLNFATAGWAMYLSAGESTDSTEYSFFSISMRLTDAGHG